MDADGLFELLDVFGSAFSECSLSLSVSLLSFFGCSIDRLAAALPLGLLSLLGSIGRGYPRVVVPVRARACGRVGLFSTMTVEAVEMVAILVVRRIRLIDGHLVCHTQAGASRRFAARRQTPQRRKTGILLRDEVERRNDDGRRESSPEQACARWVFALRLRA